MSSERKRYFKTGDWRVVMAWEGSTNFEFFTYSGADGKIWEQVASGTVTWDGDIHFHLTNDGYIHLGETEYVELGKCLAWVQEVGDLGKNDHVSIADITNVTITVEQVGPTRSGNLEHCHTCKIEIAFAQGFSVRCCDSRFCEGCASMHPICDDSPVRIMHLQGYDQHGNPVEETVTLGPEPVVTKHAYRGMDWPRRPTCSHKWLNNVCIKCGKRWEDWMADDGGR